MNSGSSQPLIGIALAVYKPNPIFFERQIRSIISQDYENWFCVISTNSPMRGVIDILNNAGIRDSRITILENLTSMGSKSNFLYALNKVLERGCELFAFSDQDDIWYPFKLRRAVETLSGSENTLFHSDMKILVQDEDQWTTLDRTAWQQERRGVDNISLEMFCLRNVCTGASIVADAQLIKKYMDVPDAVPNHDWWVAAVFSVHGKIIKDSEPLYEYRQHGSNELGVTPYAGYFTRRRLGLKDAFRKTVQLWIESNEIAQGFERAGLKLRGYRRFALLKRWDFGILFLIDAVRFFVSDPPLSRAYFSRFVGKFLHLILKVRPLVEEKRLGRVS